MKAPCYNTKTGTDCPRRAVGCRNSCRAWQEYEKGKAAEMAQRDRERWEATGLFDHFSRVRRRKEKAAQRDRRERRK